MDDSEDEPLFETSHTGSVATLFNRVARVRGECARLVISALSRRGHNVCERHFCQTAAANANAPNDMSMEPGCDAGPVALLGLSDRLDPHVPLRVDKLSKKVCGHLPTHLSLHTRVACFFHSFAVWWASSELPQTNLAWI